MRSCASHTVRPASSDRTPGRPSSCSITSSAAFAAATNPTRRAAPPSRRRTAWKPRTSADHIEAWLAELEVVGNAPAPIVEAGSARLGCFEPGPPRAQAGCPAGRVRARDRGRSLSLLASNSSASETLSARAMPTRVATVGFVRAPSTSCQCFPSSLAASAACSWVSPRSTRSARMRSPSPLSARPTPGASRAEERQVPDRSFAGQRAMCRRSILRSRRDYRISPVCSRASPEAEDHGPASGPGSAGRTDPMATASAGVESDG
jgi:hypothetical protein